MTDGVEVRIRGQVSHYAARGTVQLRMTWIDTDFTLGRLAAERDRLIKSLEKRGLLEKNACRVEVCEDTGRFAPYVDLYLDMLNKQLTYDALKIIGFDMELMQAMGGEMVFLQGLAHAGKIAQGAFVAKKGS